MLKLLSLTFVAFTLAPWALAQQPPQAPADDFPPTHNADGKKKNINPSKPMESRKGVKPPMPVTPPTPEPIAPDEPSH